MTTSNLVNPVIRLAMVIVLLALVIGFYFFMSAAPKATDQIPPPKELPSVQQLKAANPN